MKTAFIVRNREDKPYFVATTSDSGTTFRVVLEAAKTLVDAFKDEYKDSKITKQELSVALDRGMTVEGPMPETLVAQALRREPKPKEKTDEQVSVSDLPITFFSTKEKREAVEFKARAFVSESRKTTFNYEVKRVRAIWDPGLSIPGTGRRGGWRCPVGTRYGGQITDRFGRNCGWGVARRIANAITNIGERMEGLDDRRRGRRVERRNRRMLERLGRAEGGGRMERGLRGVAEALEGGERTTPPTPPRDATPTPPRRRGPARRVRRGGFDSEARDAGLRDSERRRVRRELEEPGAPRTGLEELVEPKPKPKRPARARRRKASEDRAKDTAGKRPAGEPMEPSAKPQPTPQRKKPTTPKPEPKKPTTSVDDNDPFNILVSNINNLIPLTDDDKKKMKALWDEEEFSEVQQDRMDDMVRDGNYGDVEDLKERIAINDDEKRMATERIDKDMKLLRENNPTAGEREGALRRIVLNKQDIRRRDIENEIFQRNADDPAWRRSETPETPPSPPVATPLTPPKTPTKPKEQNKTKKAGLSKFGFVKRRINRDNAVAPLGDVDDNGFVVGRRVDIGNAGINTVEQAVKHIENDGDIAEVPDEFLAMAIVGNGKKATLDRVITRSVFQNLADRGLIKDDGIEFDDFKEKNYHQFLWAQALSASGEEMPEVIQQQLRGKKFLIIQSESAAAPVLAFKISDDGKRITGEGFVVKPPDKAGAVMGFPLDIVNELLGAELAQMVGLPGEAGRVDGIGPNNGRYVILPFGGNFIDGKVNAGAFAHEGGQDEKAAHMLLNYVLAAGDRHPFNAMAYKDENGNDVIFPIDFGRYGQEIDAPVDEDGLKRYARWDFGGVEQLPDDDAGANEYGRGGRMFAEKLSKVDWNAIEERAVEQWRERMDNFGPNRQGGQHKATEADIRAHIQKIRNRADKLIQILTNKNLDDVVGAG